MNPIEKDLRSYFGIASESNILEHYGTKRHSGRYPWGSGDNPYQHSGDFLSRVEELKAVCPNGRFIILEDGNLEDKGCTIENESQIIDLQIRKQIDSIIRDLNALEE